MQVMHYSNIKQVVGKQVTQIITQAMTEYVADGRSMTAEVKLVYRVVMMTGSRWFRPEICTKEKVSYILQTNCHGSTGG
jgi:hypothetical protein